MSSDTLQGVSQCIEALPHRREQRPPRRRGTADLDNLKEPQKEEGGLVAGRAKYNHDGTEVFDFIRRPALSENK